MKILAIDTSTQFLCVGVKKDFKIYTYRLKSERRHSLILLSSIRRILRSLKIDLDDIDYLSVGLGPGSFTGIRIGIATIKGLAVAGDKRVIGIPTLDVIAYNAIDVQNNYKFICPILDAKRELVFTALYQNKKGKLKLIEPYRLITLSGLLKFIPPKTILLGNALGLYKTKLMSKLKCHEFLDEDYDFPHPYNLLRVSEELRSKGKLTDAEKIQPIYLYPKECQIKNLTKKIDNRKKTQRILKVGR